MTPTDARTLLARLIGRIAPEVDLDDVDPDVPFQDEIELDSMDFLNLVGAVHDETGISIPEQDYPRLESLNGFITYLTRAAA